MEKQRKMAMVVTHVKMDEEDIRDVEFWMERIPAERLAEITRLRRKLFYLARRAFS